MTPARLRELVSQADAFADAIEAIHAAMRDASDELTRRAVFRLDEATGYARMAGRELEVTAGDLARLRSRPVDTCPADWSCCPEHGGTLTSSGGRCWCTASGCGRRWDYDRLGLPRAEPAAFEVRGIGDAPDHWGKLCAGHTVTAREQLDGIQVRPLTAAGTAE